MRRFQPIRDWTPGYINTCPYHIDIVVECTACGVTREFQRDKLSMAMRHALITEIEERLKCSACGAKSGKLLFGSYIGDDGS
ncbi:hypothetical protein AM571_CH03331 [Rhizobium etli 8C-3]|uniref:Uncharacterized protein n=1 Tax=Rhizobium etli 8C-3 TaxID=538025 RepID=A0A1L5P7K2_RHIET|nr:hypothetical protein [Rhizobium etli]APO76125.1 hypothetical protein AM571_CH03331 [Rhizobium etli 8C-3]